MLDGGTKGRLPERNEARARDDLLDMVPASSLIATLSIAGHGNDAGADGGGDDKVRAKSRLCPSLNGRVSETTRPREQGH